MASKVTRREFLNTAAYFTHESSDSKGSDLWENLAPVERVGYLTDLLSDRAAQFITRPRTKPFYLSLHYTAPHAPWEGPEDAAIGHTSHGIGSMSDGGSRKIYASMVKSMDADRTVARANPRRPDHRSAGNDHGLDGDDSGGGRDTL